MTRARDQRLERDFIATEIVSNTLAIIGAEQYLRREVDAQVLHARKFIINQTKAEL